jgi:hypothetical protein
LRVERRFRVVFLGAGFSAPAGVPLAVPLWKETLNRIHEAGLGAKVDRDLATYQEYLAECLGLKPSADEINFEEFLGFLDLEYYLGLRGSDTWSDDGNETQVIVKAMIGRILAESMPPAGSVPDLYLRFAERLQPGDYVLSFNYDVILERALEQIGKPFRLFPDRYKEGSSTQLDSDRDEVVLLKMHGSIDWFDRTSYAQRCESFDSFGIKDRPEDPVFNNNSDLTVVPLVDGYVRPDDPLRGVYRVHEVEKLYQQFVFFRATPLLILPSVAKVVFANKLRDFWWGIGRSGGWNLGCGVIGFSLPDHDDYARQVLWRYIRNYQNSWWDDVYPDGLMKAPLALIDFRRSEEEVTDWRQHYQFVNWDRARIDLGGFREGALNAFFSGRDA